MSKGLEAKTGPYYHAADAKWEKEFPGGRKFIVLVAGAYDAGIVGPEHNGIAILDEDNEIVVLDRHLEISSGYFGPSAAQLKEAERIMKMGWREFTEFCRQNPRFRGEQAFPDVHQSFPSVVEQVANRELAIDEPEDTPEYYRVPTKSRNAVIEFLGKHSFHRDRPYDDFRLSWDIKMGSFDTSGKGHPDFKVKDKYDARWERYVETSPELFYWCCADALNYYLEGFYTTYPGDDQGHYKFGIQGRSGGHLVLVGGEGFSADELKWANHKAFVDWARELEDDQLIKLYRLVVSLDYDLSTENRNSAMAYQYASRREHAEECWDNGHLAPGEKEYDEDESMGLSG